MTKTSPRNKSRQVMPTVTAGYSGQEVIVQKSFFAFFDGGEHIIFAPDGRIAIKLAKDTGVYVEIAKMRAFRTEHAAKAWLGHETWKLDQEVEAELYHELGQF
ncbi:MAG: hypothetical protein Q8T09_02675 [Candidatus Melainabacteria bacterium]|nr:hypothetical protein [Candidatus Melainabacteria bacterium]